MNEQVFFQQILLDHFEKKKSINPSFSLRALARTLEVSPCTISEFLKNKRRLSVKLIKKISGKLNLNQNELSELENYLKNF